MKALTQRRIVAVLTLATAIFLTAGLSWFAINNYRSAAPIAEENLRGLALTIATAIEELTLQDPSLKSLSSFQAREVAYAALISADGVILFHTNDDLTGSRVGDERYLPVLRTGNLLEERIQLGTGETAYEFQSLVHLPGVNSVLRLVLHTWRSEMVMRRARYGLSVIFSLLAVGWGLGLTVLWLLRRQEMQQQRLTRQNELARLGEVGAVLAHEVRNPLAGIKGYGQLLRERLPDGKEGGYAALIISEAGRLEALVNDILLYTRSDFIEPTPCKPAEVAASVICLITPQLQENSIAITCNIPENLVVLCPEASLHRILLNLLTNALQAGGTTNISVSGIPKGGWAEISVADNGTGIPAERKEDLFEPFRTSKARGAGLGLAVCKKLLDNLGGGISADNAPGGGALFRLQLPVVAPDGGKI